MWFSGSDSQYCEKCIARYKGEEDTVLVKIKPLTFDYECVYYVPVFQKNFKADGTPEFSPNFEYSMSLATQDEQMAWSFEPDYVLELKGHFKATTKPFRISENDEENGSRLIGKESNEG